MAVLPEYQDFGIGRKLLDYATKGAAVYNLPVVLVAALGELYCTFRSPPRMPDRDTLQQRLCDSTKSFISSHAAEPSS